MNKREIHTALTIDTPQQQLHLKNIDRVTHKKLTGDAKSANALITLSTIAKEIQNYVVLIPSPKTSTSQLFRRRTVIFSLHSEVDNEINTEQHLIQ